MDKNAVKISSSSEPYCHTMVEGKVKISLRDFLTFCARSFGEREARNSQDKELFLMRDTFLDAGINALKASSLTSAWIQIGVEIASTESYLEVYRRMSCTAQTMLNASAVSNFFYMHKPPGIRIRFETSGLERQQVLQRLLEQLADWQSDGIITRFEPGVYEPETHLFGGPTSMALVHKLFTIDSLAWLDFYLLKARGTLDPPWLLSLVMLNSLLTCLQIQDWEDLDVWDRIRRQTGRCLPSAMLKAANFQEVLAEIRHRWLHRQLLVDELSPEIKEIARTYQNELGPVTAKWRSEYFATSQAYVGPREAAAIFTIFHWNRAALSHARQSILTEALVAKRLV